MEHSDAQYAKMTQGPVGSLVISLAVPTVVSMLVSSIYNMADTYFVSKISTSASGAVGIVFSLMAIIQAAGFTIGMGAGSWISRLLGGHRNEEANGVAASGFYSSIVVGMVFMVVGLAVIDPLMHLLGATDTILPYARDYARYILYAAPIMAASFVLNNFLRAEGKANFSMIGITVGGVLNCGLDPLFIFGFKMGIGGAAIATALSQLVSFVILLVPYLQGRTIVKLGIRRMARGAGVYIEILKLGFPSFLRQGLASVSTVALNLNAAAYGDAAVAAMSIVGKIFMFIFSIILGVGQGYQPVLGYNYGARMYKRVKEAFFFTLKVNAAIMTVCSACCFFAASALMKIFIASDPEVIRIGATALRLQCLVMPLQTLGVMANMSFQSIGKSGSATILSAARQGIFFLPLILTLPPVLGLLGVQITQPLADLCTFIFCLPFILKFFRTLNAKNTY
jgi:putative MATE family efflux protein